MIGAFGSSDTRGYAEFLEMTTISAAGLEFCTVELDYIHADPRNFYSISKEELENLKSDILDRGLDHTLVVRRMAERGHFALVGGERRYHALKGLVADGHRQFNQVPVNIKEDITDLPEDQMLHLIASNAQSREKTPSDRAEEVRIAHEILSARGKTQEEIASFCNISDRQLRKYLSLHDLDGKIKKKYYEGELSLNDTLELAKSSRDTQKPPSKDTSDESTKDDLGKLRTPEQSCSRLIKCARKITKLLDDFDSAESGWESADSARDVFDELENIARKIDVITSQKTEK
jgi:ParB/RepB/Spo0J family partition protein